MPLLFRDIIHILQEHNMQTFIFEDTMTGHTIRVDAETMAKAMQDYLANNHVFVWTEEDWGEVCTEIDENR